MKTVLVTGSSRGIGKETIIEFAKNGYNVIINYNDNETKAFELKKYVEEIYSIDALVIKCDVSKEDQVIDMINKSIMHFKKIDVLVNNAGVSIDNDLYLKNSEEFNKVMQVNLIGPFLVTKHLTKHMIENKEGTVIFVSSANAIDTNYIYSIDYDASKAGVLSLMRNFSNIMSPYVRVNAVAPGWVETDMTKDLDEEMIKSEKDKIMLNRFAKPEEVAKVIYFLTSEDASYINNTVIRVDGGCK